MVHGTRISFPIGSTRGWRGFIERMRARERPNHFYDFGVHQRNGLGQHKNIAQFEKVGYSHLEGTTSFIFTNFPEDIGLKELWEIFFTRGSVRDVYIPPKRDKNGKKFGFVKFKDIHTNQEMQSRLSDLWIRTFKIMINLARFKRDQPKVAYNQKQSALVKGQNSYAKAVMYGRPGGTKNSHKSNVNIERVGTGKELKKNTDSEWRGLTFNMPQEDLKWLQDAFVGTTFTLEQAHDMQKYLHTERIFSVKAAPLGGKFVLLTKLGDEDFPSVLNEASSPLSKLFEEIRPWDPSLMVKERMVWLKVTGVSAHAFMEDFLKFLVNLVGRLGKLDDKTKNKSRLDVAKILISTYYQQVINRSYQVKIMDTVFTVRMMEDNYFDPLVSEVLDTIPRCNKEACYDDSDSVDGSIFEVPETILLGGAMVAEKLVPVATRSNSKNQGPVVRGDGTRSRSVRMGGKGKRKAIRKKEYCPK